ncbi:hypothetical protein TWF718_008574 [Orbilia javanica]|uniref:F-box domain-containing protein n=1 Tax=Orbilia javanica TaxID=47235 RepID=A0AAN8MUS7_9PEZI
MANLVDIPNEILEAIKNELSYASLLALRTTCSSFFRHDRVNLPDRQYTIHDLLEIETWSKYHPARDRPLGSQQPSADDYFACSLCLKIKNSDNFSDNMMKGSKGKFANGASVTKHTRFCIACGIDRARYGPGTKFFYGGGKRFHGLVCSVCHKFEGVKVEDTRHRVELGNRNSTSKCSSC